MLPKLRIILAAVLATCAAVLALSAGMLGTRDPGNDLSGVPEVSRTLVRQAIVAEPDWQQSQLLAYSRRADELLRLRDLPVTPARAVVDYAEHAQARAAETASAPAAAASPPTADAATAPAAAASEPAPTTVASTPAATPTADAPATLAMAPVATPPGDTTAATPVEQPASASPAPAVTTAPVAAPPADTASATASVSLPAIAAPAPTAAIGAPTAAPAETPAAAPAASDDTKVAAVGTRGSETAETYGPPKPTTDVKPRHRARTVHPHPPKKKAQVAVANPRGAPAASTGFAANQPSNRNNAVGGWRSTNDSTPR